MVGSGFITVRSKLVVSVRLLVGSVGRERVCVGVPSDGGMGAGLVPSPGPTAPTVPQLR